MSSLILSGLSSIGFFEISRALAGHVEDKYRIMIVPYFPTVAMTWYEYVADMAGNKYDRVYVVGSLNYMLDDISIGILAKRFSKIVLVPDKGYSFIAHRLAGAFDNVRVFEISHRRLLSFYIHSRAKYVLPYLYVDRPDVLRDLEEAVMVPEIDIEDTVARIVERYYSVARNTLYRLSHHLLSRGSLGFVEIYTTETIDNKYMPMFPLLARQKALMEEKPVVIVHKPGSSSYAYIVVSLPSTRENSQVSVSAYDVKRFIRLAKIRYRKYVKADIAGKNTLEIMAHARATWRVVYMVVDIIHKLLHKLVDTIEKTTKTIAYDN